MISFFKAIYAKLFCQEDVTVVRWISNSKHHKKYFSNWDDARNFCKPLVDSGNRTVSMSKWFVQGLD